MATVIIWFLQTFDTRLNVVRDSSESLLALIGSAIAPVFAPLGFGDWKMSTALITGFTAKESVVSTLTVLLGGTTAALDSVFSGFTAFVFLIFSLLYTPCVAAIASIKRELGTLWAVGVVIWQCIIAWIAAFIVHCIGVGFTGSIGIANIIVAVIIVIIVLVAINIMRKKGTCQCGDGCNSCGKKKI